jgi:hypothetical protein
MLFVCCHYIFVNPETPNSNIEPQEEITDLSGLLAAREIPHASNFEVAKYTMPVENLLKLVSIYNGAKKYDRGQLTEDDYQKIIEDTEEIARQTVALNQGKYEKDVSEIVNPAKADGLQYEYEDKLSEPHEIEDNKDVEPLNIIHEIANFENKVYDHLMEESLKEHGMRSIEALSEEGRVLIKQEVEKKMEEAVHDIGLSYLRGRIPGLIGKYFNKKADRKLEQILS